MKKKKGRSQIGSKKTFTIEDEEYMLFKNFAQEVLHKKVSEVIRGYQRSNQERESRLVKMG